MAEEQENIITGKEDPVPPPPKRTPRKRAFKIDKDQVGRQIIDDLEKDIQARGDMMDRRMSRYAKLRGILPEKHFPWENAANFWLPFMLTYSLKTKSTLENATKSQRPMLHPKSLKRTDQAKEDNISKLLDYQFFIENVGEKKLDAYISNFVDDEAVFARVHYVRKEEGYRDIRVLPPLVDDAPVIAQFLAMLPVLFESIDKERGTRMLDKEGWEWELEFIDDERERRTARVEFYDRDDKKIEAHIAYTTTVFDAPVVEVLDLEDVVVPSRAGNLQPPGPDNPHGTLRVSILCKSSVDAIRRGMKSGLYDLLTKEDMEAIEKGKSQVGTGKPEEQPKEQKDAYEGSEPAFGSKEGTDRQIVEHYGRYDLDGDGLEEDAIFWVERSTKKTLKAVFLTQMYPGLPIKRPLSSESFIPTPNHIYGTSLPESMEPIQDMMQMLLNQHFDWGTIVNTPFFFYRPSSGMKPEVMRMAPGDGYPLDDPPKDIHFPQFQQRGDAYTINTMTLLQQFAERLSMISDPQFGRVPTGKASVFRTVGATVSLLAQGDVRSEQVLRRLFHGLGDIYQMMHRLNQRYLPESKEIRTIGISEQGQGPYKNIPRDGIKAQVVFEFKATMLNTNKQVLSQNLSELMAMAFSPLAVQAGIVTEDEIYTLFRKKAMALDVDPDEIFPRPPSFGPRILAEDALTAITDGEPPVGRPLEPPEEHLQKLVAFEQSPQFGLLTTPEQLAFYQGWKTRVQGIVVQRQLLMQAAGATSNGGNGGPGGAPTTLNPENMNPQVENGEMIDETIGRV